MNVPYVKGVIRLRGECSVCTGVIRRVNVPCVQGVIRLGRMFHMYRVLSDLGGECSVCTGCYQTAW